MIDKNKLVDRMDFVLSELRSVPAVEAGDYGAGAVQAVLQMRAGVLSGIYDAEPDLVAYTEEDLDTEDMTDEDGEEESAKFGVFCVWNGAHPDQRSIDIPQDFDTRSEAWSAVIRNVVRTKGELDSRDYEVRPL